MTFDDALPHILRAEGGYVDHPADPGGATNRGITQRTYDRWRRAQGLGIRRVREITDDEVRRIYQAEYWEAASCDRLPGPVALAHFDAAVNCGVGRAIRMLQEEVDVAVDGIIGPVTLGAVRGRGPMELANALLWRRLAYYNTRPHRETFLSGWVNRLLELREHLVG